MNTTYLLTVNGNAYDFISLKFDHESRDISKSPTFSAVLPNMFGILATNADFAVGKQVKIYRNNELKFTGTIQPYSFKMNADNSTIELKGVNTFYNRLNSIICDSYDFREDNKDYGVTINPWDFKVLRHTHPQVTKDPLTGELPILAGFTTDKVVQHIIGTKFLYTHDFTDASHLLPSAQSGPYAFHQIYRNSDSIGTYYQTTPRLQLAQNGYQTQPSGTSVVIYSVGANVGDNFGIADFSTWVGPYQYPSNTRASQSFRFSQPFTVATLRLMIWRTGATSGNVTLRLSTSRNSGGVTQTVPVSSLPSSNAGATTNFTNAIGFNGLANTDYFVTVEYTGDANSTIIHWDYNPDNPYSNGSAWSLDTQYTTYDTTMYVVVQAAQNVPIYNLGSNTESISLYNGDPNIEQMGYIQQVTATVYGRKNHANNIIQLYVTRNGQKSNSSNNSFNKLQRFWSLPQSVVHTQAPVPGTSDFIDKFVYTFTFPNNQFPAGRELAYQLELNNNGNITTTPEVEYIMFECDTITDTNISVGTIESYVGDPTITESNFFEGNLESLSRLQALGKVRETTIKLFDAADPYNPIDTQLSTFWDIWVNSLGQLNFKKVRGTQINNRVYSFENKSMTDIEYEYDGTDIWYKVIAYGAGSGTARTRIVDPDDVGPNFLLEGLTNVTAKNVYGEAAKQGSYENSNARSVRQLQLMARAALKIHSKPFETLKLPNGLITEYDTYYDVGDAIKVTITDLQITNKYFPIEELSRSVDKDGEAISVLLGSPKKSLENAIVNTRETTQQLHVVRGPTDSATTATGAGTYFDNATYGLYTFGISEPDSIQRVALKMVTIPYSSPVKLTSPPVFGIAAFDGDGGIGDINNAIYANGVNVWIDTPSPPTINNNNEKLPIVFGIPDRSIEVDEIDITSRLARDGTGKIKRGIHRVWVKSSMNSGPNVKGLGCIQIVPLINYRI